MTAAAKTTYITGTLNPNKTLSMWWDYHYAGCTGTATGCATGMKHSLNFYAETLDPPNTTPTWTTGPTLSCG